MLMALWREGGGEKESTTPWTTNLVGRVNSVTTSSDQHRQPFTDGTSNYPRLVFEVSSKATERRPQGGQFALHAHYASGDWAMSHPQQPPQKSVQKEPHLAVGSKTRSNSAPSSRGRKRWLDVVGRRGVKHMEAAGKQ